MSRADKIAVAVGVLCALAVVVWLLVAFVLPAWLWHPLGYCTGTKVAVRDCKGYNSWSGSFSDVGEVTLIGGLLMIYRRVVCDGPWCFRFGLHRTADGHHKLCRKHHPDLPDHRLSLAEIHERHHAAKENAP